MFVLDIWHEMLYSSRNVLLKLSETTTPPKVVPSDYITLFINKRSKIQRFKDKILKLFPKILFVFCQLNSNPDSNILTLLPNGRFFCKKLKTGSFKKPMAEEKYWQNFGRLCTKFMYCNSSARGFWSLQRQIFQFGRNFSHIGRIIWGKWQTTSGKLWQQRILIRMDRNLVDPQPRAPSATGSTEKSSEVHLP